jgi:hypothetical protein
MAIRIDRGWDLAVDNRDGQIVLAVEVKRQTKVSLQWATRLRQNILAHINSPKAPYFLMVFPDKFYLWSGNEAEQEQALPSYIVDADPILQPYLERAGIKSAQVSDQSLELIISSWLTEIIYSDPMSESENDLQGWLIESGLYAALVTGKPEYESAA